MNGAPCLVMLRLALLFAVAFGGAFGSTAMAQVDSVVLIVASRVESVSPQTIRRGLSERGIDVRTRRQATEYTDTIVVLVDQEGRRVTAFTRSPTGVDVHVLQARGAVDAGRWIGAPLARVVRESQARWRPDDLRDPWHDALRGDFIARVGDGVVDPWAMMIVAGRIDVPAIADPWASSSAARRR